MGSIADDGSLPVDLTVRVSVKNVGNGVSKGLEKGIGCTVLITMGGWVDHAEGAVDEKGTVRFNHVFRSFDRNDAGYRSQVKVDESTHPALAKALRLEHISPDGPAKDDLLVSDTAILWVFATNVEESPGSEDPDPPKRVWFVGSKALNVRRMLLDVSRGGQHEVACGNNADDGDNVAAVCTIKGDEKAGRESLRRFDALQGMKKIRDSGLKDMETAQSVVSLQTALMRSYCMEQLQGGGLGVRDETSANFMNMATFTQLYGNFVLFTDMTRVVKDRVARVPVPFVMVCAYMSLNTLCEDCVDLGKTVDFDRRAAFIRATLSAIISDVRQSEYYFDYRVHSVSECSEEDFKSKRQPTQERDPESVANAERWNYSTLPGTNKRIVIRLRMTEDQAQLFTAKTLRNRWIMDDCETSASALVAVFLMLLVIYADFEISGVLKEVLANPGTATDSGAVRAWVDGRNPASKLPNMPDYLFPDRAAARGLVVALARVMNSLSLEMDLAVGTANSASAGGAEGVSGHCFAILKATDVDTGYARHYIVEGTNWVRIHVKGEADPELYGDMSSIASVLMESTRLKAAGKAGDIGRAMMDLRPPLFYRDIFAVGDTVLMEVVPKGDGVKTPFLKFGVDAQRFLDGSCGYRGIQVNYTLLSKHIYKISGKQVDPIDMHRMTKAVSHEEAIPAWDKRRWEGVLRGMKPCGVKVYTSDAFDTKTHVRVAFTHQVPGGGIGLDDVRGSVERVLVEAGAPEITGMFVSDRGVESDLNRRLNGIGGPTGLVRLERAVTCMEMQIFVCRVRRDRVHEAKATLMGWVEGIQAYRLAHDAP